MRRSQAMPIIAMVGLAATTTAIPVATAAPLSLNDCVRRFDQCTLACVDSVLINTGKIVTAYDYKQCRNQCEAIHDACINIVFSSGSGVIRWRGRTWRTR